MGGFSEDVIKLFEEFKRQTGMYQDLDLDEVEFEEKELKDIADKIKAGGTPKTSEEQYWANDFSLIDNQEYFGWRDINKELFSNMYIDKVAKVITKEGLDKSSAWLVPENSILLAIASNSKGLLTINKVPMCINQNILGIVLDRNKYDVRYIYFFLKNHYSKIIQKGFGNLTKASESKVKILIPKPINEKYTSYQIQKAIADFIEFVSLKSDDVVNLMGEIIEKAEKGKENLLYKIFDKLPNGEITEDVVNLFNEFKEEKGYQDLNLEELEFEDIRLEDLFEAKGGNSKYTRRYVQEHKGEYPLLTGKLDNESIEAYIDTYDFEGECITYNKDNASGSKVFYRPQGFKFSMNSHHVALFRKDNFPDNIDNIDYKYSMYALNNLFKNKGYGWENSANWNRINEESIPIPKPYGNYTSHQIQKAIADFIEFSFDNYLKLIQKIKKESDLLEKHLIRKFFDSIIIRRIDDA